MGSLSFQSITQTSTTVALDSITNIQDWSAWSNTSSPPTPTDHRSGGGSTITLGFFGTAGGYTGYSGAAEVRQISWTNGTNTASSNFTAAIYPGTNGTVVNNGFTLTFPASTTAKVAYIYCGPYNCIGGVSASLSDGSATSISDTTSLTGSSGVIKDSTVAIAYQANSAGQTLTVNIFYAASGGFSGGFMTLQAAAIATGATGFTLTAASGSYGVTGNAATLTQSSTGAYTMLANAGNYAYVGSQSYSDLQFDVPFGTYGLTGNPATLTIFSPGSIALGTGFYTYTGSAAGLNSGAAPILGQGAPMFLLFKGAMRFGRR